MTTGDDLMIKLFKYLKPYLFGIIFILVLLLLQSLAELYLPTLMSDIVDTGIIKGDTDYILKTGIFMLFIAALSGIATIVASYLASKISANFGNILRNMIFTKCENFSLFEFDKFGTSSLITRTTNDVMQIQQVLVMMVRIIVSAPIMCIGGIIMAYYKDKELTLIFLIVLPILVGVILIVALKGLPLFKSMQVKIDKLNLVVREYLNGIRVIRAFNREPIEKLKFKDANEDLTNTAIKVNKLLAFLMPTMMLIMNITTIAIIWFGGIRIDNGDMQIGGMMAFMQYAMQIMFSLIMVSMVFVMIPRAQASAVRINEVLAVEPEIYDADTTLSFKNSSARVEFKNVSFKHHGAENPAIKNISFIAKQGETTAIIGGTGSGKTTLLNMITRFYDATEGSILINNIDVKAVSQKELRARIGYIPQTAVLFSGTVKENVLFGKETATEEEIINSCKIAQAHEFIDNMPEKYDSVISQGGTNLSGGQKQRLSIARALVRKPQIYLFDDSFSALDYKTDSNLRAALKNEITDSVVIIVAQRVSTIMNADKIIVLDEGEIASIGTHDELLKSCKVYYEIVSSQLSKEELA